MNRNPKSKIPNPTQIINLARAPPGLTPGVLSSAKDFAAHDGWRKTNQQRKG
jgi:hypothetical protein